MINLTLPTPSTRMIRIPHPSAILDGECSLTYEVVGASRDVGDLDVSEQLVEESRIACSTWQWLIAKVTIHLEFS